MYLAPGGGGVDSRFMANEKVPRIDTAPDGRQSTQTAPDDQIPSSPTLGAGRADCCSAAPALRVVLATRLPSGRPAELLLCAHHYRASCPALAHTGATVFDRDGQLVSADHLSSFAV